MKLFAIRSLPVLALAALLTACGGSAISDTPMVQTAAVVQTVSVSAQRASGGYPAPDCAAEGCSSLRIIDGNAEAYRVDAMRRAAAEAGQAGQS
jgi:hypothetical protein